MASVADSYNYPAFSFALEDGACERFLREAPQLAAPATPFELPDLEGRHHRLGDYLGRPVVVEFGSYTCPIFCGHGPAMERLAAEHREAVFLVVYTREAHPGERTPAHGSIVDKLTAARRLRDEDGLGRLILIDDLDGTVSRSYGAMPDAGVVLDAGGCVVLRQAWNDPGQVAAALDALRQGRVEPRESVDMCPPPNGEGFGHGLLRGGRQAVVDFYLSAPPPIRQRLDASTSAPVQSALSTLAHSQWKPDPLRSRYEEEQPCSSS